VTHILVAKLKDGTFWERCLDWPRLSLAISKTRYGEFTIINYLGASYGQLPSMFIDKVFQVD